ncbi:MAG: arsenate reductase ArsC [Alphaproteobacteria bacterium]|nr:MAG: arsenate reductase ArsC [Alphaproteobacteria bacterium]
MANRVDNVLFLCTGNSARSIMAEAILDRLGEGRFRAFSAGSHPAGDIHPETRALLQSLGYRTEGLRSKGWEEFSGGDRATMDLVITVCDQAAKEACPVWPGQPVTAHWGFEDPVAFRGAAAEKRAVFARVYNEIEPSVKLLVKLAIGGLGPAGLKREIDAIGRRLAPRP